MRGSLSSSLVIPPAFLAVRYFREGPRVSFDGFRDGLAVNELPLAAAGDQPSFAENLEMVGHGCGSDPAHGNDFSAIHMFGAGNGLENSEPCLVGQSFRYFLNLRAVHRSIQSVAKSLPLPPERTLSFRTESRETCNGLLRCSSKYRNLESAESGRMDAPKKDGFRMHSARRGRPT